MKKKILLVFTATILLALASCESSPENTGIEENSHEINEQISEQILEAQTKENKTFEELKKEAEEATRKAKERIRFIDSSEKTTKTFEQLKKDALEDNQLVEN